MLQPVQLEARTASKGIAYSVWFVTSAASTEVLATFDDGSHAPATQFPPIAQARWVHVDLDLDDVAATVSLSFDGATMGSVPFSGKLADGAETTLYVGVTRSAPAGARPRRESEARDAREVKRPRACRPTPP